MTQPISYLDDFDVDRYLIPGLCRHCGQINQRIDGHRLRMLRIRVRIRANHVAREMGISKQRLWSIENNYQNRTSLAQAQRYLAALRALVDPAARQTLEVE